MVVESLSAMMQLLLSSVALWLGVSGADALDNPAYA